MTLFSDVDMNFLKNIDIKTLMKEVERRKKQVVKETISRINKDLKTLKEHELFIRDDGDYNYILDKINILDDETIVFTSYKED